MNSLDISKKMREGISLVEDSTIDTIIVYQYHQVKIRQFTCTINKVSIGKPIISGPYYIFSAKYNNLVIEEDNIVPTNIDNYDKLQKWLKDKYAGRWNNSYQVITTDRLSTYYSDTNR
jgi:hypothetical protein